MVKRKNKLIAFFVAMFLCLITLAALMGGGLTTYAESPIQGSDGVYSAPVNLSGLAMGADNFSPSATVEKSGENYYMTFGHSSSISDMVLESGNMQTGYTVRTENGWTYYTYTLSAERLQSSLSFSAYINAMSRDVNFTITLNLGGGTRTGDYVDVGERPAEYVPVIETTAGREYEAASGSVFPIPSATATLGSENLDVSISAYYVQGGEQTEVPVTNNSLTLENVGEYHVVYRAESATYKTNLGNNTYTEYDVAITSVAGGSTLAKFEDANGVLAEGTSLLAGRITAGSSVFATAADKMASIADNFEVFGISYVSADGTAATPGGNITLYLQADMTYDRNEVVVYHMADDGTLTEIAADGYGRYVKFDTDKTGTFIVCIPGVAFVMPMWGYAVILVACVLVVAAAVTVTAMLVRRKKKANKATKEN
ncbi:MAG TPA: hypothetical protein H9690_01200 [Firmicutes bacterium]|nr:hypothetical protein [Bacillota bacterium]